MGDSARVVHGHEVGRQVLTLEASPELHLSVLRQCVDVPEERPLHPLYLPEVGISGKTVCVHLPEGRIPFTSSVNVDLSKQRRGIHMSRIEDTIATLCRQEWTDLQSFAVSFCRQVVDRQGTDRGSVCIEGKAPISRTTPVSGRESLDSFDISVEVRLEGRDSEERLQVLVGVGLNHITACPCTQEYNKLLFGRSQDPFPMPTHSQRSFTRLVIEQHRGAPLHPELVDSLSSALHVTQDLLKRSDEAEVVLLSHRRPQFIEDAVREVAYAVSKRFSPTLPQETKVLIESTSFESIHIHDVCCRLSTSLGKLPA